LGNVRETEKEENSARDRRRQLDGPSEITVREAPERG